MGGEFMIELQQVDFPDRETWLLAEAIQQQGAWRERVAGEYPTGSNRNAAELLDDVVSVLQALPPGDRRVHAIVASCHQEGDVLMLGEELSYALGRLGFDHHDESLDGFLTRLAVIAVGGSSR